MTGLSERLKKLRNNYRPKLSQQALSERLGINRATYARYETGDNEPDYDTLEKIAQFYNVSIDFLITGREFEASDEEMWKELLNPKTQLFFKDLKDAPDDKIEELIQFWEFIKNKK